MTDLLNRNASAGSAERVREIEALGPWFHNLHLPDGAQTAPDHPLGDFPSDMWQALSPSIPADLEGWTALDIGCNSGLYSVELARRGAHVTAIDIEPLFLRQAAWAAREFDVADRITLHEMPVYDVHRLGTSFDLVLFMGVFYHLRYPLLALDIVARAVRRTLVFQSLSMPGNDVFDLTTARRGIADRVDFLHPGWPKMAFVEHEFAGDSTNWWIPNHAAVEAMLRSAGLRILSHPGREMYLCEPDESVAWRRVTVDPEMHSAIGRADDPPRFGRAGRNVDSVASDPWPRSA